MKLGTVEHIFRVEDAPSTTELSLPRPRDINLDSDFCKVMLRAMTTPSFARIPLESSLTLFVTSGSNR